MTIEILLVNTSLVNTAPSPVVNIDTILSNLTDIIIAANKNKTNPNPALIINTGVLKNIVNSFLIKDLY